MASIFSFLERGVPAEDLDELYGSPWASLAVFQSLAGDAGAAPSSGASAAAVETGRGKTVLRCEGIAVVLHPQEGPLLSSTRQL